MTGDNRYTRHNQPAIRPALYNGQPVYAYTDVQYLSHPPQYPITYQDGTQAFAPVDKVTFTDDRALSYAEDMDAENARLRAFIHEIREMHQGASTAMDYDTFFEMHHRIGGLLEGLSNANV